MWSILCSDPSDWGSNSCLSLWLSYFCRKLPSVDSSPWKPRLWPQYRLLSTHLPWPQTWDPSLIIAQTLSSMGKLTFWGHLFLLSLFCGPRVWWVFVYVGKRWGAWKLEWGQREQVEGGGRKNKGRGSHLHFFFNLKFKNWWYDKNWTPSQ